MTNLSNTACCRLEAICLNCLGPYAGAARLEIKPITILCGPNGTGKSTWLRLLRLLLVNKETLPFSMGFEFPYSNSVEEKSLLNSIFLVPDGKTQYPDPDSPIGPPGSFTLEVRILEEIPLPHFFVESTEDPNPIVGVIGRNLEPGTLVKLRFFYNAPETTEEGLPMVEYYKWGLYVDEWPVMHGYCYGWSGPNATSVCVASALASAMGLATTEYKEEITIGLVGLEEGDLESFAPSAVVPEYIEALSTSKLVPLKCPFPPELCLQFASWGLQAFQATLMGVLSTLFPVGAIRDLFNHEKYNESLETPEEELQEILRNRHVGERGQHSLLLSMHYGWNGMWQPLPTRATIRDEHRSAAHLGATDSKIPTVEELTRGFTPGSMHLDDQVRVLRGKEGLAYTNLEYQSYWLHQLLNIDLYGENEITGMRYYFEGADMARWNAVPEAPSGYLFEYTPSSILEILNWPFNDDDYRPWIERFRSPTTWSANTPALHSAGFHQIYPMVIQAGLMRRGDVCAIENPEVHLHPDLQLALTSFFLQHAKKGKQFLIETHSDLVIRRIVRAMLEEDLGQEQVRIWFTRIEKDKVHSGSSSSVMERIMVNERGQISNWPRGFMDASMIETSRLMEAVYGAEEAEDND